MSSTWQWLLAIAALIGLFCVTLGLRATPAADPLARACDAAAAAQRSILVIGGGSALVEELRGELGRDAAVHFEAAPEGEVLELLAALDERDPAASVELLIAVGPELPDAALLDHLAASGREATFYLPPNTTSPARASALATMIQDRALTLIDLDHPLLAPVGETPRILALNLIHELNLPLARRPFEDQIVHPEGHDRSLVHRVDSGYAEGGARQALFDHPEGVAISRDGARIIIADTRNHVLRELRHNMQFVETVAGQPRPPVHADGPARTVARLDHPRAPELLGEVAWFIDGEQRDRLRALAGGELSTPRFAGPRCRRYRSIRARLGAIWALCDDSRLLRIDAERRRSAELSTVALGELVAFDVTPEAVYFADADGRLWSRAVRKTPGAALELDDWRNLFANTGAALLPHGHRRAYPYDYDELRLARVVDLRFIDRYGGLLVADEFPIPGVSERVHLRYFDLERERILPWIKALPHAEAFALYNEPAEQIVSYWHVGSMAIAQGDASLVWLERERSRLVRIADGLLGVAKSGNHHTRGITIPILMTIAGVARTVETQFRPDRHLDRRHEPLARAGPYVALLLGSSMSSMSDRYSNYSLGRRLELELQRELGYRDRLRIDLFQVSWPAASLVENVTNFDNWMRSAVPPDVVFIEAHDFGGGGVYLQEARQPGQVVERLGQLKRLADRYDTLVVFYDLSAIEANRREGMRGTDRKIREVLAAAEQLGFVVLDLGDRLVPELLRHAPWGNQPFAHNQHHGAPWAVDRTAALIAAMIYPRLSEFLRGRIPARERERPASWFEAHEAELEPLRLAFDAVELDRSALVPVDRAYVQTLLVDRQLRVYVDLTGFGSADGSELDAIAVAVIDQVLREDVYAELADSLLLELVEFRNYDEYGNGVVDSADSRWRREFDRAALEDFLRR